uniref:Uncharacterized protein n=1 Tax=Coccidioides posadasii RMSCC 3488 TaxID=454284 RepID=A0A0J6FJW9_COCPO|nr:hypothetical protein CPAG_05456 [Coccidioides posadasii RMSCC 3488]
MSSVQRVFATIRAAIVPPNKRGTAGLAIFVLEYQSLDLSPPPEICYKGPTVRIPTHAAACHEKRAIVCGLNIAHPPAKAGGWVKQLFPMLVARRNGHVAKVEAMLSSTMGSVLMVWFKSIDREGSNLIIKVWG